jgi:hypothetical protein
MKLRAYIPWQAPSTILAPFPLSRRCMSFRQFFTKDEHVPPWSAGLRNVSAIPSCPPATYECHLTPELDIDRDSKLSGTMAWHSSQILCCTSRSDWQSRIENDSLGWLARGLKAEMRPSGILSKNGPALITFGDSRRRSSKTMDFYLFPAFKWVSIDTGGTHEPESELVKKIASILDEEITGKRKSTVECHRTEMGIRSLENQDIHVLVCGHSNRDQRCGVMGPLLKAEFEEKLPRKGIEVLQQPPGPLSELGFEPCQTARVSLISHIGGHKFAGNVIIHIPPAPGHPLSGMEIWYGRVEPRHVEGIVKETIVNGRIIEGMLRGVLVKDRKPRA